MKITIKVAAKFLVFVALISTHAAQAQDVNARRERATAVYNEALAAAKAGDYEAACRGFNDAAIHYENAITALMSANMSTEEQRENVKSYASGLQADANDAKRNASSACGRPNEIVSSRPSDTPQVQVSTGTYTNYYPPEFDIHGSVDNLQIKLDKGYGLMVQASTQYQAKDFSGACASSRVAANAYAEARVDARAIVDGRYVRPDTIDLAKIDANAAQSAVDAAEFYCKGRS